MSRKLYTTVEVAKITGVKRPTLQHWIKTGKISAPKVRLIDGKAVRLWTKAQVTQVRRLKGLIAAWITPEARARMSARLRKLWADPDRRARRSAATKKMWDARRRA